jgi:hypothetical protein
MGSLGGLTGMRTGGGDDTELEPFSDGYTDGYTGLAA